ncbi:hypothetical protein H696_04951 [Fonticula alba]|uniref:CHCH domain-containing protein n=1 Tax=Fonticula alba TaxID=691883 RepID=A0A058Z321_FONAL|nr:hypothetical protein H696_04951 [Fonticula alba]KCV68660.1 hypothetical protein H696_04951 [Fonticula alba]|eukprot:XP_009497092.1 hypothetical protein H696_04951 [Fonticula alba]
MGRARGRGGAGDVATPLRANPVSSNHKCHTHLVRFESCTRALPEESFKCQPQFENYMECLNNTKANEYKKLVADRMRYMESKGIPIPPYSPAAGAPKAE